MGYNLHSGIDLFQKKFIILLAEIYKITVEQSLGGAQNEERNTFNRNFDCAYHSVDNRNDRHAENIAPAERSDRYRLLSFEIVKK